MGTIATRGRPSPAAWGGAALALARRDALFVALFAAGAALRAVVLLAYTPALVRRDSMGYLANAARLVPDPFHPAGYPLFLRLVGANAHLAAVPLVQHLLAAAMALVLYALLLRLGVRRWVAAAAVAPLLLDAYQLNIEQHVLSETIFELTIVAACVLLLWRRPLDPISAASAGVAIAASGLVRTIGVLLIVPAALAVLGLRVRASRALTLLALATGFAVPLAAYAAWYHDEHGRYALTAFGGRFLYARVAPFADCSRFDVPARLRVLCPTQPVEQRPGVGAYIWHEDESPLYRVPERQRDELGRRFAHTVIVHQPLTYARTVATEFAQGLGPRRTISVDAPIDKWQFQRTYPLYWGNDLCSEIEHSSATAARTCAARAREWDAFVRTRGSDGIASDHRLTAVLHAYQRVGYAPGPLLAVLLLLALAAVTGLGGARRSGLRGPTWLFAGVALTLLLGPVALNQFSWRYQLPPFMLIAPAGALALTALTGWTNLGGLARERARRAGPWPWPSS